MTSIIPPIFFPSQHTPSRDPGAGEGPANPASRRIFRGRSLEHALELVRHALGEDAIVVRATANPESAEAASVEVEVVVSDGTCGSGGLRAMEREPAGSGNGVVGGGSSAGTLDLITEVKPTGRAMHASWPLSGAAEVAAPLPSHGLATAVKLSPVDDHAVACLRHELSCVQALYTQVRDRFDAAKEPSVRSGGAASQGVRSDRSVPGMFPLGWESAADVLWQRGVEHSLVRAVVLSAFDAWSDAGGQSRGREAFVLGAISRLLLTVGVLENPLGVRSPGAAERPRVVAFVGPTGVGKTTTIAKLAAHASVRGGLRVGLVTADTYRMAAVDQLRTYAGILGLPLRVAMSPGEVRSAVASLAGYDLVLLDTPGRSQRDGVRLEEDRAMVEAGEPVRTHLVLSLATDLAANVAAASRSADLGPDGVIYTKLDEAAHSGALLNAALGVGLPLSYICTGQEVPEHMEEAEVGRVARRVWDGLVGPSAGAMGESNPAGIGLGVGSGIGSGIGSGGCCGGGAA